VNTHELFRKDRRSKAPALFAGSLLLAFLAVLVASSVQTDFGKVEVTNLTYDNFNGIKVRAKLLRPAQATELHPMPGVLYIHGYQNNRETGDAYCIELARRGFVVLEIDAIGRGNSGIPNDPKDPDFDRSYGGQTSLEVLRSMPFVRRDSVGLVGHSLGAEMAYRVALKDPEVKALVITGFAYTLEATRENPRNMLMVIGRWDEFRRRMTGTQDIEREWMKTDRTRRVFPVEDPEIGKTYGEFASGTARRVVVPRVTHVQETHSSVAIAETLEWMRQALHPAEASWIDAGRQIWPIKEWSTLVAMVACLFSLLPLGLMLLRSSFFSPLQAASYGQYSCSWKRFLKYGGINCLLMWLYLPLIFVLFGLHIYVVRIDKAFPMMMVNGIVWWFFCINLIGFFLFRRWFRKRSKEEGLNLKDLGISYETDRFSLHLAPILKTALLASLLFAFAYFTEYVLEKIFIADFRFIFPFASDLTPHRALLGLRYLPFLLAGFVFLSIFLHGQLRRPRKNSWLKTFISWSWANILVLVLPLILFLMIQYIPLFASGVIPFVGPGGMFVSFILNLFHMVGVLLLVIPISTWFYQITGKIYLGAFLNGLLVTWMYVSSQVIAPIPV
jgi:pimeloyl-ACP methyl ester carboxylesterase